MPILVSKMNDGLESITSPARFPAARQYSLRGPQFLLSCAASYVLRRPWNGKDTGATVMVNDVAWVTPEDAPGLPL